LPATSELQTAAKVSRMDFSFSQSGPYKSLGYRTKSQIWAEEASPKHE